MDSPSRLEIHYFLKDNSHTMDALVRNKCEAEFLAIAYEVISELGLNISIDSEVFKEGGLREVWKMMGKNSAQLAFLVSVVALGLTQVPSKDAELVDLEKQHMQLSIEEKKLTIEKLKKELEKGNASTESVNTAVRVIDGSYKVLTRKSNFYKNLSLYEKVTQLGVSSIDDNGRYISDEIIVPRSQFSRFILSSHELKPVVDENAVIEIVAPVLKEGRAKWKGIYNEGHISFAMNDKTFKQSVLMKQTRFTNGSGILCVLKINQKLNEVGEVVSAGYVVDTVLEQIESGVNTETSQGRNYRFTKSKEGSQRQLFASSK
jgi:hypothetical protein